MRHRSWTHETSCRRQRSYPPRRPSRDRRLSPSSSGLYHFLALALLIAFVPLFWATVIAWTLLDWRYAAAGVMLLLGTAVVGCGLALRWLP